MPSKCDISPPTALVTFSPVHLSLLMKFQVPPGAEILGKASALFMYQERLSLSSYHKTGLFVIFFIANNNSPNSQHFRVFVFKHTNLKN